MKDLLLERITAPKPVGAYLHSLPWPSDLEPAPVAYQASPADALPTADVVICAYTAAEGQALADTLTPGIRSEHWLRYAENWDLYEPHLTGRSPAKFSRCMAIYQPITIGGRKVLCMKSDLHLATDDDTMPIKMLWKQIIAETGCEVFIDTGTAGGIGSEIVEGDCIVGDLARFDCQKMFKDAPFAQESFPCTLDVSGVDYSQALSLMAINAGELRPEATRDPEIVHGDVLTTDFFAMDTSDDAYGLRAYDPNARAVEMDAASLGLACQELGESAPKWITVRSASDPQIPSVGTLQEQSEEASRIYMKYGYWVEVETLCAAWQIITSL